MFARFGAVGSIGGLLFAYWADIFEDNNAPDFAGQFVALGSDDAKMAALSHQDAKAAKITQQMRWAAIFVAVIATLQWGFGDLFFQTECPKC